MFDNISQGLFMSGSTVYLIIVPVLRALATLFMVISTYKLLKARQDKKKFLWLIAIIYSPIIVRIAYEVYRRWIVKKDMPTVKWSSCLLTMSIITYVISAVLFVISIVSMGVGYVKSEIDNEPISVFYDVYGNEYYDVSDVPLYDKYGNTYTHQSKWFTVGTYVDQDGNAYDGDYCYLSEDGFFYFDKKDALKPYSKYENHYYTDGETVFYDLFGLYIYWENDGTIYAISGRIHLELFKFLN